MLAYAAPPLTKAEYESVVRMLRTTAGIVLQPGKEEMVKARLNKRLRHLRLTGFGSYLRYVESDPTGAELAHMVDLLTTNKTSFFREADHFDFLARHVARPWLTRGGPLRVWSAGCSTGEEPYSIALSIYDIAPDAASRDARVLGTDISPTVLAEARSGCYVADRLDGLTAHQVTRHFRADVSGTTLQYDLRSHIRKLVSFAHLNLMDEWPMSGPFHAIFCRNVMIYFDKPTQRLLAQRFAAMLAPGGYLLCGHSESLTNLASDLSYVQPAVYRKEATV